jgi:ketosteroid isomerase-like protein
MSAEENMALLRRFLEAFANGDLDTLDELLAPDFVKRIILAAHLIPSGELSRGSFSSLLLADIAGQDRHPQRGVPDGPHPPVVAAELAGVQHPEGRGDRYEHTPGEQYA